MQRRRVTAVTYPDSSLDILYTYDDPGVPFSKGRLTRIARPDSAIAYRYDRFGRLLQDGALGLTWDANGNAETIVYPGGVTAVYTHDFADRPASLLARRPGRPDQPLAASAGYHSAGPLKSLTLGNGLSEARTFTSRYFPSSIALTGISQLLNWTYSTDAVGNILSITDTLTPSASRTYGYQDVHYFLTRGDGPWGPRAWTYDKIGNRLTETRGAVADTYSYLLSSGGGRSPILSQIQLGAGGTRTYQFGPAGHLEAATLGANSTLYRSDDAGRLSALENPGSQSGSTFRYDGRDYLTQAASGVMPFQNGFETGDLCGWTAAVGALRSACQPVRHPTSRDERRRPPKKGVRAGIISRPLKLRAEVARQPFLHSTCEPRSHGMDAQRRFLRTTLFLACLAVLALLPTPAAAQDGDSDGLPDSLELSLAQYFFPILNLHCGSYEGMAYADRRQLYGLTVAGYTNSSNGRIPFTARPYTPNDGWNCTEDRQCIVIRYGIAWNWDLGDDTFGGAHRGDSEMYAILVARKDTDGADWGVSWEAAQNDPSQWRLIREFMSAHWGTSADSSSYRSHGNYGTSSYQRIWAAEGKHALYQTQNACNNGGFADADDCGDNRCDIVNEVFLKVQNIGESYAPLNRYIPYPGSSKTTPPSGSYDMWSYQSFGNSTAYRQHMETPLNWCPNTWCF